MAVASSGGRIKDIVTSARRSQGTGPLDRWSRDTSLLLGGRTGPAISDGHLHTAASRTRSTWPIWSPCLAAAQMPAGRRARLPVRYDDQLLARRPKRFQRAQQHPVKITLFSKRSSGLRRPAAQRLIFYPAACSRGFGARL